MGEYKSDEPGLRLEFPPLPGEKVLYLGRTADGTIALTDYRLFLHHSSSHNPHYRRSRRYVSPRPVPRRCRERWPRP